jgi:hypothetical protein
MGENPLTKLMEITIQNEVNFLTIEHKKIKVDEFISTTAVHCQRLEEPRHKSVKKILGEKLLPTHLEVALVQVHFQNSYYSLNNYYSINGNTRKFIWGKFDELKPNELLNVTIYHAFNQNDVETIYRSIDSGNSVETPSQMIGGLYRSTSFTPLSKKLKGCSYGTALKHAYAACTGNRRIYDTDGSVSDIKNKKEYLYFVKELEHLDKLYFKLEKNKDLHKKFNGGNIMSTLLIMFKKHGIDNEKLNETVDALFTQKVKVKDGVGELNDGVSIVWSDLYDKHQSTLQWTDQSEGYGPIMMGKLLYCLDAYMNDTLLITNKSDSNKGIVIKDNKAMEFFRSYFTN